MNRSSAVPCLPLTILRRGHRGSKAHDANPESKLVTDFGSATSTLYNAYTQEILRPCYPEVRGSRTFLVRTSFQVPVIGRGPFDHEHSLALALAVGCERHTLDHCQVPWPDSSGAPCRADATAKSKDHANKRPILK